MFRRLCYRQVVLLTALALAGCAGGGTAPTTDSDGATRISSQLDLPLTAAPADSPAGADGRVFSGPSARGWIAPSGEWGIRAEVSHPRLRCADYAVGIRLGRAPGACEGATWLEEPSFGPTRTQCNGATLIHSGGGTPLPADAASSADCVRVMVRCRGAC